MTAQGPVELVVLLLQPSSDPSSLRAELLQAALRLKAGAAWTCTPAACTVKEQGTCLLPLAVNQQLWWVRCKLHLCTAGPSLMAACRCRAMQLYEPSTCLCAPQLCTDHNDMQRALQL